MNVQTGPDTTHDPTRASTRHQYVVENDTSNTPHDATTTSSHAMRCGTGTVSK